MTTKAEREAFLAFNINRHSACHVERIDWPYDCDSKRLHPDHAVYACTDHGAWWHLPEPKAGGVEGENLEQP